MADALPDDATHVAVVLGLDAQDRPHAAKFFGLDEVALAERAATAMGMHFLRIEGEALQALVAELPNGQLYKSGNALTPLVKQSVYDQLIALGTAAETLRPPQARPSEGSAITPAGQGGEGAGGSPDKGGGPSLPHMPPTLEAVMVGSMVGVAENPGEGWWEALAIELAPADDPQDDLFTLKFRDSPDDYPKQVRRRADLALLPPSAAEQ